MVHTSTGLPTYLKGIRCQEAKDAWHPGTERWWKGTCVHSWNDMKFSVAKSAQGWESDLPLIHCVTLGLLLPCAGPQFHNYKMIQLTEVSVVLLQPCRLMSDAWGCFWQGLRGRLDQWPLGPPLPLLTEQLCLRHWIMCLNKGLLQKTGNC